MITRYSISKVKAWAWIKKSLLEGPSLSLSKAILDNIEHNDFNCFSDVGDSTRWSNAINFSFGGVVDAGEAYKSLVSFLSLLSSKFNYTLIAEDWCATATSNFLSREEMPAFFYNDEVYYAVESKKINLTKNLPRILSNTVPTFNAFLAKENFISLVGNNITGNEIDFVSKSIIGIICGAYDGEGYIICIKNNILEALENLTGAIVGL